MEEGISQNYTCNDYGVRIFLNRRGLQSGSDNSDTRSQPPGLFNARGDTKSRDVSHESNSRNRDCVGSSPCSVSRRIQNVKKVQGVLRVADRHPEGVCNSNRSTYSNHDHRFPIMDLIQRSSMVHQSLLNKIFYRVVPVCALSTAAVLALTDRASARSLSSVIMEPHGILTSPNTMKNIHDNFDNWVKIGELVYKGIQWVGNLPKNIPHYSVDLFSGVYKLIADLVLQTPTFIFDNSIIQDKMLVFSGLSVLIVSVMTAFTGIKQMIKKRHTDVKTISYRFLLATIVSGFAPFIFKMTFSGLNYLSTALNKMTQVELSNYAFVENLSLSALDTTVLIGFDLVSIALLIPILLQSGKRWFDLLCLSAITPLAMSSFVFNETRRYYSAWLEAIISKGKTQLVYAFFIFIMSVFMFGTVGVASTSGLLIKMLILLGGLMTMANPPRMVLSQVDKDGDIGGYANKVKKSTGSVYRTLTFNKFSAAKKLMKKFRRS